MGSKSGHNKEVRISYRGEEYLVRDNGLICRLQRSEQKERPSDGIWTYGNQCLASGYMKHVHVEVHRIVATAFHGEPPSSGHVVDHIDTNRRNNCAENLRWVTRLENITQNPTTLRRIEQKWGSIEGMLQDPHRVQRADPLTNRPWMRQKTDEDYLRKDLETVSLTPLARQRNWRTPTEFPMCPGDTEGDPLTSYYFRLKSGSIFSRNQYGESKIEMAELSQVSSCVSVITQTSSGVKPWAVAEITFEEGSFVHTSRGSYFSLEGADKAHCETLGRVWSAGDTFDDYC